MIIEAYLYGLVIGTTMCSFCAVPLVYLSSRAYMGDYRAIGYLFATRTLMVLIAIPLIVIGTIITLLASIAMIAVGAYGFMNSLEGRAIACKSHTAVLGGLICVTEGFPAVLSSPVLSIAVLNSLLFSLGTITPLLIFLRFRKRISPRLQLLFSAMLIVFAFFLLYRSAILLLIT